MEVSTNKENMDWSTVCNNKRKNIRDNEDIIRKKNSTQSEINQLNLEPNKTSSSNIMRYFLEDINGTFTIWVQLDVTTDNYYQNQTKSLLKVHLKWVN